MEKIELQILRKEIQTKISETKICWVCGRDNILTMHHAIPQRVKSPIANLEIPVCENCIHAVHHGDDITAILKRIYLK
ncbi:MAG: hypothetical protein ACP5OG_01690 [Candidatus Nanoarchaeia archaeon]